MFKRKSAIWADRDWNSPWKLLPGGTISRTLACCAADPGPIISGAWSRLCGRDTNLHRRDAVDLDVEGAEPLRHADEDARRRVIREIPIVDRVDGGELSRRGAIDIALEHLVERGA